MLFPTLWSSSLPVVVAQPDERHANRAASVLEWYDTTSGSNEENVMKQIAVSVDKYTFYKNNFIRIRGSFLLKI